MTTIFLYQVLNSDGVVINQWYSTDNGPDYWEPGFGEKEWREQAPLLDDEGKPVLGEDGEPVTHEVVHPATYKVIENDVTYELELAEFRSKRASAYPPVGDQLDARYKADMGDRADLDRINAAIGEVKRTIPKPAPRPASEPRTIVPVAAAPAAPEPAPAPAPEPAAEPAPAEPDPAASPPPEGGV